MNLSNINLKYGLMFKDTKEFFGKDKSSTSNMSEAHTFNTEEGARIYAKNYLGYPHNVQIVYVEQ